MGDLSQLGNLAGAGAILVVGIIILVFAAAAFFFGRGRGAKAAGWLAVLGVVVIFVVAFPVALLAPTTSSVAPPAPSTAAVNVLLNTGPTLPTGVSWNSQTNILQVDIGYNYTSKEYVVAGSNTTPTASAVTFTQGYVNFPLTIVRTDALNSTYSFPLQVTTVPTFTTLNAPTTTYSFVGYTAPTGSSVGNWIMSWSTGTTAGQHSTVNAPSVNTNVLPDGLAVNAFSSKAVLLSISFGGGNSTSAPTPWSTTLTTFETFNMPISIGQGTPAQVQVQYIWTGYSNK
jgi:hypothetical protein